MPVFGVAKFERFFQAAAELDVDKTARDIIEPWDLPIAKGLQESMHAFRKLDEEIELQPILGRLSAPGPFG